MSKHKLPKAGTLEIAPSILSADFANLAGEIGQVTGAGVRMVHIDVMDGHFVPNITIGPVVVKWLRRCTEAAMDVHLMISEPEKYAQAFVGAGADHITFHIETVREPAKFIKYLHGLGVSVGITLNPDTPVAAIEPVAAMCDMILVMTVHPGFGAQEFIDEAAKKCVRVREIVGPGVRVEVDGGINADTIWIARDYGADTFVAGNAIFARKDRAGAIKALKKALEQNGSQDRGHGIDTEAGNGQG